MVTEPVSAAEPLLTLAIPTYNRAEFLRENLDVLFPQLLNEPRVELIISDNDSSDATPEVVAKFQQRGLAIRSVRNVENLGSSGNILQCFSLARGQYAWIMGDDDIAIPGSIARILSLLENSNYGLVFLTPFTFRADWVREREPEQFSRPPRVIASGVTFIRNVGQLFLFTSSVIINKQDCTVDLEAIRPLTSTFLIQMGWQLDRLTAPVKHLLVYEKLIGQRLENSSGWGACRVFGVNYMTNLDALTGTHGRLPRAMRNLMLQSWMPHMVMSVRTGTAGPLEVEDMRTTLESLYRTSWRYWRYWIYLYPLIILKPASAARWYKLIEFRNRFRPHRLYEAALRRLAR